jgi:diguanylate cyclase (GGDEF)-like protein
VVGIEPGQCLFLAGKDEKFEIQGNPACVAEPGDVLDAVGFPGSVETRPALVDSICRKLAGKSSVGAVPLKPEQVLGSPWTQSDPLKPGSGASSRNDMNLVRMQGTLVQSSPGPEGSVLMLASGGKQFLATLPGAHPGTLSGLGAGSILELTGVCLLNYDEYRRAQSFRILLRNPADVVVLKAAPWWNLENAMRVLSAMAIVLMAAIVWVVRQSIQLRKANKALQKLSFQDALTGVANRRKFDRTLEKELRRAARSSTPVSLIMVDIDFFKRLNDRYGHQKGDECLVLVAHALQSTRKRFTDLVARYGGEEFAIILPGSEPEAALGIAEGVREAVEDLALCHEDSPFQQVSISAGIATVWPDRCTSAASLIALADQALYQSKMGGRNRVSAIDLNVPQGVF